jgi:hypothetical protein
MLLAYLNNHYLFWESYEIHSVGRVMFLNIKAAGTYSYHYALNDQLFPLSPVLVTQRMFILGLLWSYIL